MYQSEVNDNKMKELESKINSTLEGMMESNYWSRFELRSVCRVPLGRSSELLKLLYPEIPPGGISMVKETRQVFESAVIDGISMDVNRAEKEKRKGAERVLRLIKSGLALGRCVDYFSLDACDELHPMPGVYWNLWFMVVDRSNDRAFGVAGHGCD